MLGPVLGPALHFYRGVAKVLLGQRLREVGVVGAHELHEAPVHQPLVAAPPEAKRP